MCNVYFHGSKSLKQYFLVDVCLFLVHIKVCLILVYINVCLLSVPINMFLHHLGKIPLHDDDLHLYLFKSSNYSLVHLSHVSWFHESVWSLRDSLIHIGHVTATANTRNRKLIWSEDYTQSSTAQFKWKYFRSSNNLQHWDLDSHSFESWVRIIRNRQQ